MLGTLNVPLTDVKPPPWEKYPDQFVLVELVGAVENGATTWIASAAVAVAPAESVTRAVKLERPAVVGVPERTPPDDNFNPAGGEPETIAHVYGGEPPDAWNVVE